MNMPVIISYILFFTSSLLTVVAYSVVPLAKESIFEATGYIWVSVLGVFFLGEKIIGMLAIVVGIIIFNLG